MTWQNQQALHELECRQVFDFLTTVQCKCVAQQLRGRSTVPGSLLHGAVALEASWESKHQQLIKHRFCEADVLERQAPTLLSMMIASSYMGPPWRLRLLLARWRACATSHACLELQQTPTTLTLYPI